MTQWAKCLINSLEATQGANTRKISEGIFVFLHVQIQDIEFTESTVLRIMKPTLGTTLLRNAVAYSTRDVSRTSLMRLCVPHIIHRAGSLDLDFIKKNVAYTPSHRIAASLKNA